MIPLPILLSIFLTLPGSHAPMATGPIGTTVLVAQGADIKAEVDRSLRWVRAQQDLESGSYGSVHATLQVLKAMATSPRAYRLSDGPYMAKAMGFVMGGQNADGSFGDPGSSAHEKVNDSQTAMFLIDVLRVPAAQAGDANLRAMRFLGEHGRGVQQPYATKWRNVADDRLRGKRINKRVTELLSLRSATDHWEDGRGALLATCASVLELNTLELLLKAIPKAKSNQPTATALPKFESSLEPVALAGARKAMLRGAEFLVQDCVAPGRWGFQGQADAGITAMTATALLSLPAPRPEHIQASIDSALSWLLSLQHGDGSIHTGQLHNYVTSASVMALVRADKEAFREPIARARKFLVGLQADEGEGYSPTDRFYGGVGYGGDERPDLSNMNMALEALADAGLEQGDETFVKALSFLQRCQNRSESNDLTLELEGKTFVSGNDGGSGYAPGDSKAGYITLRNGRQVPRSYGSMTYALLKGYLFAGLPKNDGRVQAAWQWLSANYTLDVNPGFEGSSDPTAGYQGLFYYFTTMSKALDLYGQQMVTDPSGREHDWRAEMVGRVLSLQRQDGSWINSNAPRWYEGNPVLASSYALVTLANALPGK